MSVFKGLKLSMIWNIIGCEGMISPGASECCGTDKAPQAPTVDSPLGHLCQ